MNDRIGGAMGGSMSGSMSMGGAMGGGQEFLSAGSMNSGWGGSGGGGVQRGATNIIPFMTMEGAEAMMDGLIGKKRRRRYTACKVCFIKKNTTTNKQVLVGY